MQGLSLRCCVVLLTTAAPAVCQKFVATDGEPSDWFGYDLATEGDLAVVGAPMEDEDGPEAGAAYVFERGPLGWNQVAKLTAEDGDAARCFGWAVAIDAGRIVVGSPGEIGPGRPQGRVHVFELEGGQWTETAELVGASGSSGDGFGSAVAIENGTLAVGAHLDDEAAPDAGAVYRFAQVGGAWVQVDKVWSPDATVDDFFGYALDVSGNTLLVGAYSDDDGAVNSGSAYTYEDSPIGWLYEAKLTAPNPGVNDLFGRTLDLDGDRAVVGNPHHDLAGRDAGAAHVFERGASGWSLEATLVAPDPGPGDAFGHAVAMEGEQVLVGAPNDDDLGPNSGSTWVFRRSTNWFADAKLLPQDGQGYDYFGLSISVKNGALVSSFLHDAAALDAGAVYPRSAGDLSPVWIEPYCFCESGPCGNDDGRAGCGNVTGFGALLAAAGSTSVEADDLVLATTGLPPFTFGVLLMAGTPDEAPLGDGLRCLGLGPDGVHRYGPRATGMGGAFDMGPGVVSLSRDLPGAAEIFVGSTWHFQTWYRDTLGPCGTGSNLSNAATVTFQP